MYRSVLYHGNNPLPKNWKRLSETNDSFFKTNFENEKEYDKSMGKFLCIVLEKDIETCIEKYKNKYPFIAFFIPTKEKRTWELHEENGFRYDIYYYTSSFEELIEHVNDYNNEEILCF